MSKQISQPTRFIHRQAWRTQAYAQSYKHDLPIETGQLHEIAAGVYLLRLPMPFALDHINVYLLEDGAGFTLIDCGLNTSKTREIWTQVLAQAGPLKRIIVTHHHPDHIGAAGWLAEKYDVPVFITAVEYEVVGRYSDPDRDIVQERSPLWLEHGLPAERVDDLVKNIPNYTRLVSPLAAERVHLLDTWAPIQIGARRWTPIIGRGHSPEHLSLLDKEAGLLIGGDQVLPEITPNIAVWPGSDQNPLFSYFETLEPFLAIGQEVLHLPSHHQPMYGTDYRAQQIYSHHEERLGALWSACTVPVSAYDLMPVLFGRMLADPEMGFGLGEIIAHLYYLESQGLLQSELINGVRHYKQQMPAN